MPTTEDMQSRTVPTTEMPMMMMSVTERKPGGDGGEGGGGEGGGADGGGGWGGGEGGGGDGAMIIVDEMPAGGVMPVTSTPKAADASSVDCRISSRMRMHVAAAPTVPRQFRWR